MNIQHNHENGDYFKAGSMLLLVWEKLDTYLKEWERGNFAFLEHALQVVKEQHYNRVGWSKWMNDEDRMQAIYEVVREIEKSVGLGDS